MNFNDLKFDESFSATYLVQELKSDLQVFRSDFWSTNDVWLLQQLSLDSFNE